MLSLMLAVPLKLTFFIVIKDGDCASEVLRSSEVISYEGPLTFRSFLDFDEWKVLLLSHNNL